MQNYTSQYYYRQQEGSKESAKEIIPLILKLISPKSVIDVGCGVGTWLAVFKERGIEDILGIDGDYVDKKLLQIPPEKFLSFDLKKSLKLDRKFDLVVCLEVAEHLPEKSAENFIKSLAELGPIVLFSAAVPFQGGRNHINEQWPEYWQKIFEKYNYVAVDALRGKIWKNDKIEYWYRQNILFFVDKNYLDKNQILKEEYKKTNLNQISIIHPELYIRSNKIPTIRKLLSLIPKSIKNSIKQRFLTIFAQYRKN
ncbi:class I SAM-dependent methyltransferase [Patescibacteria group bacterium]|nr:class I SAM-dependent methyltransferase [Patescibacteria group bacterium]